MLISVVVPCFNVEPYITGCLESVLAQTHDPLEIICIDDGSTDGTLPLLRSFAAAHGDRIIVLAGENRGAPVARNRGLELARGDYVQFLDADDLLHPRKLEHQAALVRKSGQPPDLIAAPYLQMRVDRSMRVREVHPDPWIALISTRLGKTSPNLWRRIALLEAGGWEEGRASSQESALMFRMLRSGANLVVDPECLTTVNTRPGSISTADMRETWRHWLLLRMEILEYLHQSALLTPERRTEAGRHLFNVLRMLYRVDRSCAVRFGSMLERTGVEPSKVELGRFYHHVHRVLGFRWAERLHPTWSRLRERADRWAERLREPSALGGARLIPPGDRVPD